MSETATRVRALLQHLDDRLDVVKCTAAPTAPAAAAAAAAAAPDFAKACELERLRRERDAAVEQEHASLRRERNAAVAEAQRSSAELAEVSRQLAALREAHTVTQLRAEAAAARAASDAAAKAAALERMQAANTQLAAANAEQALRLEALEAKLAVLLHCFTVLEAEHQRMLQQHGAPPPAWRRAASPDSCCDPAAGGLGAWHGDGRAAVAAAAARPAGQLVTGEEGLSGVERQALGSTHLELAVRCAELEAQLAAQCRAAQAAQRATAAAEEQAAGLRLLLARQAGGGGSGSTAALAGRLDAACQQVEEARAAQAALQAQLEQARGVAGDGRTRRACFAVQPSHSPAHAARSWANNSARPPFISVSLQRDQELAVVRQEKGQLQQDLRVMLAARGALAALKSSLQRGAATAAGL